MWVAGGMKKLIYLMLVWIILSGTAWGEGWRRYKTPHYFILSQISQDATQYVGSLMEYIHDEYSKRFTFPHKPQGRFILKIFRNTEEVKKYLTSIGGSPNWQGAYIKEKKELVVSFQQSRISFRSLLFHEGFHQFLEYYIPYSPVWFNEGLAEYFSYAVPKTKGKFKFGLSILPHLNMLAKCARAKNLPSIGKVVGAPHSAFHHPSREKIYYAKSWLLIHYLISNRKGVVNQILKTLAQRKTPNYVQLLGPADNLEKTLQKYTDSLLARSGEYFYEEGLRYFNQRNYDRAMGKFTHSLSKNPHHVKSRHYRGLIHFQNKNFPAAIRDFTKIIHMGYDWPATFYYRGLANAELGKKKEALLDLNIARTLDPKNPMVLKALQKIR